VEPGRRSVETARTVRKLASDIGLVRIGVLANKVRGPQDRAFLEEHMEGFEILGMIPYSERVIEADMGGMPPYLAWPGLVELMGDVVQRLLNGV